MRSVQIVAAAFLALSLSGCVRLTLAWAKLHPDGAEAAPPVLAAFGEDGPVANVGDWERRRAPALRDAFEANLYGAFPQRSAVEILDQRVINETAFGGRGALEEWTLKASATFDGVTVETINLLERGGFPLEVVLPKNAKEPVPVVVMETFCPWWEVVPDPAVARPSDAKSKGGAIGAVAGYVFGRYICTPPFEMILDRGYGVAALHPRAIPDRSEEGLAELRRLSEGYNDDETRWGSVAAWSWLFLRVVDALEKDPRIDREAIIAWGHSRYGKSALLAAAYDKRIAGVIAHQSGTGGASLNRLKKGESIKAITGAYPHWFAPAYGQYAGRENALPVDQHQLLALIAPRPVLLGNARRDVWSDPNGAFRAAMGADPVYELYGGDGLEQTRLDEWRPAADLAFWIRPGTHGVVEEDWPAFLEFLDAHFRQ